MAPRCGACCICVGSGDSVAYTEECGAVYHIGCAPERFSNDSSEMNCSALFRCESCAVQRSSMTPRTPEDDHGSSAACGPLSSGTAISDDGIR